MICGDEDPGTPPDRNQLIASKIPGGRYEGIAKARHLPNVERPDQFNRLMMCGWRPTGRTAPMDFAFTEDQLAIKDSVGKLCAQFDGKYWLKKDKEGGFPEDFYRAMADAGWLGIAMPEEYGGSGLGITEAAIMMQAVAESGAALQGASADPSQHLRAQPDRGVRHRGAEEAHPARHHQGQGQGLLRRHRARRRPQHHGARHQGRARRQRLRRARQEDLDHDGAGRRQDAADRPHHAQGQVQAPTDGLSLFYTDFDRSKIEVREIEKMGRKAIDTNQVFIDGLKVPLEDRIGEEGKGFHYLLHGLNPERILIAAEAIGIGKAALAQAPRNTPRSASCSAGRSARTRRSSIRWPRAGCSSRPPTC